jgi:phosphoglycerate dehydrogenase-like enzyme
MKILSTIGLTPEECKIIEQAIADAELVERRCRTMDEMTEAAKAMGGCDVLFGLRVPDELMRQSPNLKWIQLMSAGADHIMRGVLAERTQVIVTTASGTAATTIAEYTLGSMLAYVHGMHVSIRAQLRREWHRNGSFVDSIDVLRGKTLGIIGYGSIGRETARLAQAFGMKVLALKRNPADHSDPGWNPPGVGDPEGKIPARFYGPEEREAILRESDFIMLTLPLTSHTRKFIGKKELAVMRPHAYIVNIGRGEIIDQEALIETLREKRIGGAGLDVFEREPLESESGLWDLDNAILTPHVSGAFRDYNGTCCQLFAENLRRYRSGQPLLNLVDRTLGY